MHTLTHHAQANAQWQWPQTGGEDQFLTQCATDIHKIRPWRGRWRKEGDAAEMGVRKMASGYNGGEGAGRKCVQEKGMSRKKREL